MTPGRTTCLPIAFPAPETISQLLERFVAANVLLLLLQGYLHIGGQAVEQTAAAGIVAEKGLQCGVGIHLYITSTIGCPPGPGVCSQIQTERERMTLPLVQYCKKCRREVPLADRCAHCGSRLGRNSETLSFDMIHVPVKDWFCWNAWLRIALPAVLAVVAVVVAAEAVLGGPEAAAVLLQGSFLPIMLVLVCIMLLSGLLLLWLQRGERIHYAMDRLGLHAWTYLENPKPIRFYARLMTPDTARQLEGDERALLDMTLIRHQFIAWKDVCHTHFWKENGVLLVYRPRWWQVMAVHCPFEEMAAVEQMVLANRRKPIKSKKKNNANKRKDKARS